MSTADNLIVGVYSYFGLLRAVSLHAPAALLGDSLWAGCDCPCVGQALTVADRQSAARCLAASATRSFQAVLPGHAPTPHAGVLLHPFAG